MRLNLTLAALALIAAPASPQNFKVEIKDGRPVLPPAAQPVVAAFEQRTAALRARFAAIHPDMPVPEQIKERVAIEQGLREAMPDFGTPSLTEADKNAAIMGIWSYIWPVDPANTAYLKTALPADGWFRNSRDGDETTHGAWLLVQHSPDKAFMAQVLKRMKPLAQAGEVRGGDYALLYDRTETQASRPQYYGSQYHCENGRYVPNPIRDPEAVDDRRRAMGMSTMAENGARLNRKGC